MVVEIEQREINGVIVLELKGVAEFGDSRIIKQKLGDISESSTKVVLDFCDIEYIGSSVLGVLATESKKYRELGGDIKVACLNDSLTQLFRITRFNEIFSIFDDVDSAVASFLNIS